MSRFSIIVPVHNAAGFVAVSLASVLGQAYSDFELIVVDDGSSDGTGPVVDAHAARDDRIIQMRHPRPLGAGAARMTGLCRATGEYLLFLDADDAFADPAALAELDRELTAFDSPDVLLYDFTYFDFADGLPCSRHPLANRRRELLKSLRGLFRLADHPEALRVSWVPWNKAYRRSFVAAAGLRFPSGYYEDALWSTTAVLAAASISTSARSFVNYRCCRADSYSQKPDPGHLGVLDRYEQIAEYMRAHPELSPAQVREEMARVMSGFLEEMASRRRVIPAQLLPDFRSRAQSFLSTYFPDRSDAVASP